jgi:hypothetical protein
MHTSFIDLMTHGEMYVWIIDYEGSWILSFSKENEFRLFTMKIFIKKS